MRNAVFFFFFFFSKRLSALNSVGSFGFYAWGANSLFTIAIPQHRTQRFFGPSQTNRQLMSIFLNDLVPTTRRELPFYRDIDLRYSWSPSLRGCNDGAKPQFWLQRRRLRLEASTRSLHVASRMYHFIGCFETVKYTINTPSLES